MSARRVHVIDLDYLGTPGAIAAYVLEGPDGHALIETGPGNTTGALERGLDGLGIAPRDIGDALVTHIHFDHAGAAGWMAAHGARIHVHEFGAPHLVDPSRLLHSARRIYGERMEALWGTLEPVPEALVRPVHDGDVIEAAGMRIRAIETPGHARHHHAFAVDVDGAGRVCFTGDAGGTYIAECPTFMSVPTPPPEFDLDRWLASIERLDAERFDALYPTHFGIVTDPAAHLKRLARALREHAGLVSDMLEADVPEDEMRERYRVWFIEQAEQAGASIPHIGFYVKDTMAAMNVTGMMRWWTKLHPAEAAQIDGGPPRA